nr:unnamed protein product [Digitaria exilis]
MQRSQPPTMAWCPRSMDIGSGTMVVMSVPATVHGEGEPARKRKRRPALNAVGALPREAPTTVKDTCSSHLLP